MSTDEQHEAERMLLGAYVLGGLDASERARADRHLADCAQCRAELVRLAPLPGLLRRLPQEAAEAEAELPAPPLAPLLTGVRAARSRQRFRTRLTAVAAAVLLLGGVATATSALDGRVPAAVPDEVAASVGLEPRSGSTTSGRADLVVKKWGTAVTADLQQLAGPGPYRLLVVGENAQTEQAATWGAIPGGATVVTGATSIQADDIDVVQVLDASGTVVASTG